MKPDHLTKFYAYGTLALYAAMFAYLIWAVASCQKEESPEAARPAVERRGDDYFFTLYARQGESQQDVSGRADKIEPQVREQAGRIVREITPQVPGFFDLDIEYKSDGRYCACASWHAIYAPGNYDLTGLCSKEPDSLITILWSVRWDLVTKKE